MSTQKENLRVRVRRGIAVLNERRPSWVKGISTSRLQLEKCDLCVLGQLYQDDYYAGLAALNGEVQSNPGKFGFTCNASNNDYWDLLTEVWREEIATQRRLRRSLNEASVTTKGAVNA